MGITGLIPFLKPASKDINIREFSGCTVAIDSYCWLHKGAYSCVDKLVRGEHTDAYVTYCLKYVDMLLSHNIKPILVFDGRHLPAKALTETKRREDRQACKKKVVELLSLGKTEEARNCMSRSIDITHEMALALIKECRKRNVDCIVAPYEADSQLAYLNINNIAQLVITEDSDLVLFGCTKVLFKLKLDGNGTLVERTKLPLVMKCPTERYQFDKFRQMCILSGCDYLPSLRGVGLVKAQKFVNATQSSNFAHALKSLPSYLNLPITVTDEYREDFQKAEATFKHQYVYDPLDRSMVRLNETDDEDEERVLCVNAGDLLDSDIAFQLALGNLDPFTLKKMDDWHPDFRTAEVANIKTSSWKGTKVSTHPSIWSLEFRNYLDSPHPWRKVEKKPLPIIAVPQARPRKQIVHAVAKYVPETEDQSLSIETLSNMYCFEPASKKIKSNTENIINNLTPCSEDQIQGKKSPILENKERSFKKALRNGQNILKSLSKFPRTTLDDNVIESNFFSSNKNNCNEDNNSSSNSIRIEESPERISKNPFKVKSPDNHDKTMEDVEKTMENQDRTMEYQDKTMEYQEITLENQEIIEIDDGICTESDMTVLENSQKENSLCSRSVSPILDKCSRMKLLQFGRFESKTERFSSTMSQDSVIENTYPLEGLETPADSQILPSQSPPMPFANRSQSTANSYKNNSKNKDMKKASRNGIKKAMSLPSNQPTLLSMFVRTKKPVLKR